MSTKYRLIYIALCTVASAVCVSVGTRSINKDIKLREMALKNERIKNAKPVDIVEEIR